MRRLTPAAKGARPPVFRSRSTCRSPASRTSSRGSPAISRRAASSWPRGAPSPSARRLTWCCRFQGAPPSTCVARCGGSAARWRGRRRGSASHFTIWARSRDRASRRSAPNGHPGTTTFSVDGSRASRMNRFFKLTLRTSDVEAALAFYGAVLGPGSRDIVQLHEQAVARGARPHWLGFLEVEDVDATLLAFTRRGATRLSPTWVNPAGLQGATLRDPGGAVLGLARRPAKALDHELDAVALRPPGTRPDPDVVFCDLNTADVERAMANYTETFGWGMKDALDLGSLGTFHAFAWEPGRATVGSMSDVATRGASALAVPF